MIHCSHERRHMSSSCLFVSSWQGDFERDGSGHHAVQYRGRVGAGGKQGRERGSLAGFSLLVLLRSCPNWLPAGPRRRPSESGVHNIQYSRESTVSRVDAHGRTLGLPDLAWPGLLVFLCPKRESTDSIDHGHARAYRCERAAAAEQIIWIDGWIERGFRLVRCGVMIPISC